MQQVYRIGVIAALTGPKEHIGKGILNCVNFVIKEKFSSNGLQVELHVEDDCGQAYDAVNAMRRCISRGCIAVIGPGDSDSMHALLKLKEFSEVPILTTLATGTDLAEVAAGNFFRVTTPNVRRVELLFLEIVRMYPNTSVDVYASSGSPESFSQSLKRDVISVADSLHVEIRVHDFSTGRINCVLPQKKSPVVICAQSAAAVALLKHLRAHRAYAQCFSFGSNTNFLARAAVGTVVVSDLYRGDANPKVKQLLEEFSQSWPEEKDPSLSSMNAAYVLLQACALLPSGETIDKARKTMLHLLRNNRFQGLFGPLRFDTDGEMLGYENICLSRVRRTWRGYGFSAVQEHEHPVYYHRINVFAVVSTIIAIVGAITGVISVIQTFLKK